MAWASEGFDHRFTRRGDEIVVTTADTAAVEARA
jgi:hypothetical protein